MAEEKYIEGALRQALAGQGPAASGPCPDANMLAAYLERGLSGGERTAVEVHASTCDSCRALLALSLKIGDPDAARIESAPAAPLRSNLFRFVVPLSATAALVLAAGIGIVLLRNQEVREKPQEQLAEVRSRPAQSADLPESRAPAGPAENETGAAPMKEIVPAPAQSAAPGKDALRTQASEAMDLKASREDRSLEVAAAITAPKEPGGQKVEDQAAAAKYEEAEHRPTGAVVGGVVGGIAPPRPADEKRAGGAAPADAPAAEQVLTRAPVAREVAMDQSSFAGQKMRLSGSAAAALDRSRALVRRMAAERKSRPESDGDRALGGRRFVREEDHWVDLSCLLHPEAEMAVCEPGSLESQEILKSLPGLADLKKTGSSILVFWSGRILLIR
jgi:hypothetical protein